MKPLIHLLVVDPQNDFCDLPEAYRMRDPLRNTLIAPALPVPGAHADLQRLARFVRSAGSRLARITVTLDSHHRLHIAHPGFWHRGDGAAVAPFTPITATQVRAGAFLPNDAGALPRVLHYLDELEARGRYTLMVWPVHCEIGSWGHGVHPDLRAAYNAWEDSRAAIVSKVLKGSNPWTEHYSAIAAEVPDPDDPASQFNHRLIEDLAAADLLIIGGEASSHCVRATTEHIVDALPDAKLKNVVLLTDAMSPVTGFASQQGHFLSAMRSRGVRLLTTTELQSELRGSGLGR